MDQVNQVKEKSFFSMMKKDHLKEIRLSEYDARTIPGV